MTGTRTWAVALAGVAVVATAAPAAPATSPVNRAAAGRATAWLVQQDVAAMPAGQQADIITSRRITGTPAASLRAALAALAPRAVAYATTAGARAKIAIAQAAAGRPGALAGHDYLGEIASQAVDGRYGTTAFDQCLSMIALRVSGRAVPQAAVTALLGARTDQGGWAFSMSPTATPDPDSTSMAVIALRAGGVAAGTPAVAGGVAWLGAHRTGGGWAGMTGAAPNADSTALAARAQLAAGGNASASVAFVRRLQQPTGAVANTRQVPESRLLATIAAVPALAGVSLANGFRAG